MEHFAGYGFLAAGMVLICIAGANQAPWSRWYRGLAGTALAFLGCMIAWGA